MGGGFSAGRRRSAVGLAVATASALLIVTAARAAGPAPTSSPQPTLPPTITPSSSGPPSGGPKPTSPVVESTIGAGNPKRASRRHASHPRGRHRLARRIEPVPPYLARPAVAGVALLVPLPRPPEPPHFDVPLPAYPLDSIATLFTTPPAPIVCHHAAREPGLPDPELYRERTLRCEPDNP